MPFTLGFNQPASERTLAKRGRAETFSWQKYVPRIIVGICLGFLLPASAWAQQESANAGALTSISVQTTSDTAGGLATYTISFTPATNIPADGRVKLSFPKGFDLSNVIVASGAANMGGGLTPSSPSDSVVVLSRDGSDKSVTAGTPTGVIISIVMNRTTVKSGNVVKIETQDVLGVAIDSGNSPGFAIIPGALHHFTIVDFLSGQNITNKKAGENFQVLIRARDAFDNVVTSFNNKVVTLDDSTHSVSPKSATLLNGAVTALIHITKAQNNTRVLASAGGRTGSSNSFNITSNELAKFNFSLINNQVAGIPFSVTITAQDDYANTVTTFAGTVKFGSTIGTVAPANSGAFSNGVRVESVKYATIGNSNQRSLSVTDNGGTNKSGASNLFSVTPGEPSGEVKLITNPNPPVLPADDKAEVTINTQTPIKDSEGNNVGSGKVFTVVVSDASIGQITTDDAEPTIPGLQIKTVVSHLSFKFKAGKKGGSAAIVVTGGSASGNVSVSVNELRILSVTAERDTVSDQSDVKVSMVVQNFGKDDITLTKASLLFNNKTDFFEIRNVSPLLPVIIPGNFQTQTLQFTVRPDVNDDAGLFLIDGKAEATVGATGVVSDSLAEVTDEWLVQTEPVLSYLANSRIPSTVSVGSSHQFSVRVRNTGQATLVLNPDLTTFQLQKDGATLTAQLDANRVRAVAAGDTTLTFRVAQISESFPRGKAAAFVDIVGTHNGTAFTLKNPFAVDSVNVTDSAELEIVNIRPSQPTVTRGMTKLWRIKLDVRNNTGSSLKYDQAVDSLSLRIFADGRFDTSYEITKPTAFASGFTELEPNSTDSLEFRITRTGTITGAASVFAYLSMRDEQDNEYVAQSLGTQGGFVVQTPAALSLTLLPSQARITQGQTADWFVVMRVTNSGQSDVAVQFTTATPAVTLEKGAGYNIDKPKTLEGNPVGTIKGLTTRDLIFTVDTSGTALGKNRIGGTLAVKEVNSNRSFNTSITAATSDTSVLVETPARIRIEATVLANVFNGERVNAGQQFQVRTKIKNLGEEKLDNVWVKLRTNGNSKIANNIVTTQGDSAVFNVTAANDLRQGEIFTATIDSSVAANTKAKAQVVAAIDDKAQISIDNPANLYLVEVTTDLPNDTVAINQEADWRVFVIVRAASDSGNVIFDSPQALSLELNSVPQTDYTIKTPTGLHRSGLELQGGERDTLIYVVQQTGRRSGDLTITARLSAKDKNDIARVFTPSAGKQVYVEGKTVAQILKTRFASTVNQNGSVGFVNLAQKFPVEVDVQNLGPEQIEWAVVSIKKASGNGEAFATEETDTLRAIPNTGIATATFLLDAGGLPSIAGDFEVFEARLDTARTLASAVKITRTLPDTIVRVKIETPASLQMSATTDPPGNDLSKGQTFKIRTTVKNLGQAKFDNSGRLQIVAPFPNGFTIFNNDPQPFTESGAVEWTVTAPNSIVEKDTFFIKMITRPQDGNSSTPVLAEKDTVALIVNVHESELAVTKVVIQSPEGATDSLVSTEQRFVLKAKIRKSANLNSVRARFKPINGYALADNETANKNVASDADSVLWRLVAPSNEDLTPTDLEVRVDGTNTSGETVLPDSMSIPVRVQARANLRLTASITSPSGAANGQLSFGQALTLSAELNNNGSAEVYGDAKVKINLGNSGLTLDENETEEQTLVFSNDRAQAVWQAHAPDTLSLKKPLTFTVTQFPKDRNTDEAASIEKKTVLFEVSTNDRGTLTLQNVRIHEPEGAKDSTLSTEQLFTITANMNWNRADSVIARLILPEGGFLPEALNDDLKRTFQNTQGNTTPFWRIKAPTQAIARALFKIEVTGVDASDPDFKFTPQQDSIALEFVRRADLTFNVEVTNPEAARDRVVSVGQPFEITAIFANAGDAQVVGVDSIRLAPLPEGYRLDERETQWVKRSIAVGNQRRASWWVIAPNVKSKNPPGETITMRLQNFALDENTGQVARVDVTQKQTTVLTEEKRLQVRKLEGENTSPAARGQDSLAVLCLELKNTGSGENSSTILLRRMQLYVSKTDGTPLAPSTILRSIRLVNANDHSQLFGKLDVTPNMRSNPVMLNFDTPVAIGFETPQMVKLLVSLTNTDSIAAFSLGFQNSTDLLAKDQDSDSLVTVEDAQGRTGLAFKLNSGPAVLFEAKFENFYNYPNPFGADESTGFIYTLSQDSEISLEIYTLLGELVWKKSFGANEAQGKAGPHKGDITWDGLNGKRKRVLNGVYLAVLKTNRGTVMTKVAVIK